MLKNKKIGYDSEVENVGQKMNGSFYATIHKTMGTILSITWKQLTVKKTESVSPDQGHQKILMTHDLLPSDEKCGSTAARHLCSATKMEQSPAA